MSYTIVQHSGYVYGRKGEFKQGIEEKQITAGREQRVRDAGGLIFQSYKEACEFAEKEAYQWDNDGLIPNAPGTFSVKRIDGLPIYVPKKKEADDE